MSNYSKLEIVLAAKDISEGAFRSFKGRVTAVGQVLTSFGTLSTTIFAGTAATAAYRFTEAASDMQETVSKAETIFGAQAAAVKAWEDDSDRAMGYQRRRQSTR